MDFNRNAVLWGLLLVCIGLVYIVLREVFVVIVLAITVAYVLYPLRLRLRKHGFSHRMASALTTLTVFLLILGILTPISYAIYRRRESLADLFSKLPETVSLSIANFSYEFEIAVIESAALSIARNLAIDLAVSGPVLVLGTALFTFVLYGLLYRPLAIRSAVFRLVPSEHHDIVRRLHHTTQTTLYSIYVIQFTTAAATFLIAMFVFFLLGYEGAIWLALLAGLLQFIPIIGPSILIVAVAALDIAVLGFPFRGIALLVLGLAFVSLLPDVTIRPYLASRSGSISSVLYFVGFVGGILTLGAIGFIVGPLVLALLAETIELISEENEAASAEAKQTTAELEADNRPQHSTTEAATKQD